MRSILLFIAGPILACYFLLAKNAAEGSQWEVTELRFPRIQPKQEDLYLCHSIRLDPNEEHNIVRFVPHGSMDTVHHILVYGCAAPGSDEEVWNCGEMAAKSSNEVDEDGQFQSAPVCADGEIIIYAWGMGVPQLQLPKDVGFRVGGKTKIQSLVVQAHYMHPIDNPDYSGVTLYSTRNPMPKSAGVVLMATDGVIPAHSTEKLETACIVDEDVEIHPFAFRTHTHKIGEVVSGYAVQNGKWKLIGKRNPQDPQMFYPVNNTNLVLRKNDILAARCTMTNKSDREISIGSRGSDEMCNFYMMYWVDGEKLLNDATCLSPGAPNYYWAKQGGLDNIPDADASSLP